MGQWYIVTTLTRYGQSMGVRFPCVFHEAVFMTFGVDFDDLFCSGTGTPENLAPTTQIFHFSGSNDCALLHTILSQVLLYNKLEVYMVLNNAPNGSVGYRSGVTTLTR